uniref:Uncharacterized protein n=1 Tax=viral metagenome TaxID=1070528 RepID=A0A6H2A2C1_9ZZZZ
MARWDYHVKVKHLFTEKEDHTAVQKSMTDVADVIQREVGFAGFSVKKFRSIPEGDDTFGPVDYANRLIDRMYDFADSHGIWIE